MSNASEREVVIRGESIELAQLLKFGGLAGTGGEAKQVIASGLVKLNGVVETQRGKSIKTGDRVTYEGQTLVVRTK
jgi:ribosome-associated protein